MKINPWETGELPYWTNPENGYEWYVDKSLTEYCTREINDLKPLDAVAFLVVEVKNDERTPVSRVLIDRKSSNIIAENTSFEALATKIDLLRFAKTDI
jgi:hypothetical protein